MIQIFDQKYLILIEKANNFKFPAYKDLTFQKKKKCYSLLSSKDNYIGISVVTGETNVRRARKAHDNNKNNNNNNRL